jgi:hypothetical protein
VACRPLTSLFRKAAEDVCGDLRVFRALCCDRHEGARDFRRSRRGHALRTLRVLFLYHFSSPNKQSNSNAVGEGLSLANAWGLGSRLLFGRWELQRSSKLDKLRAGVTATRNGRQADCHRGPRVRSWGLYTKIDFNLAAQSSGFRKVQACTQQPPAKREIASRFGKR